MRRGNLPNTNTTVTDLQRSIVDGSGDWLEAGVRVVQPQFWPLGQHRRKTLIWSAIHLGGKLDQCLSALVTDLD